MELVFEEYQIKRLVNVHRRVCGPLFWDRYSAHPYVGCRAGCAFCYLRGGHYGARRAPEDLDRVIRVKTNAPDRLRRELGRLPRDVLLCGDWQQPAEGKYGLSRRMLEIVRQLGFPLLIIERSPLLLRDIDLLRDIHRRAGVSVMLSINLVDRDLKRAFEPRSPGVRGRLAAMEALAQVGILVGTALMPIIPFATDDPHSLAAVVQATKDHGGSFVVPGGLTMEGPQAEWTLQAAARYRPEVGKQLRQVYREKGSHLAGRAYRARLALAVRELCGQHGLRDLMPRPVVPGPLSINRRIAERLFVKMRDLELALAPEHHVWVYRKAAWAADEHPESLAEICRIRGDPGLASIRDIGPALAPEIRGWLKAEAESPENQRSAAGQQLALDFGTSAT